MRDRLIELIDDYIHSVDITKWYSEELDEGLADHLLANGVIVPPCKVGDTVWFKSEYTNKILSDNVVNIRIQKSGITVRTIANYHLWADEVFLSREEAERALKGGAVE